VANEFDLIARYFSRPAPDGYLGVGDDCALFTVAPEHQLATSTDLLIEGRHFFADADPQSLGHKALAVNLSDLAAMGSQPLACLLSLSLPHINHSWLAAFSDGFYTLADDAKCPLVGGDTTRSVTGIVISVTVMGQVRPGQALRRDAARPGDDIWVTGALGAADVALRLLQGRMPPNAGLLDATRGALERPLPPTRFGQRLAGLAHAAIDLSDGLAQDLGHILTASQCGATLRYCALPVAPALAALDAGIARDAVLHGGDVYQLCFTASVADRKRILTLASEESVRATRVGSIQAGRGLTVLGADDQPLTLSGAGFDHFS
jgi:thiamine-monophosphate kinase